jgi:hypothetical protein
MADELPSLNPLDHDQPADPESSVIIITEKKLDSGDHVKPHDKDLFVNKDNLSQGEHVFHSDKVEIAKPRGIPRYSRGSYHARLSTTPGSHHMFSAKHTPMLDRQRVFQVEAEPERGHGWDNVGWDNGFEGVEKR